MLEEFVNRYLFEPIRQWRVGLLDCLPAEIRAKISPVVTPYVLTVAEDRSALLHREIDGQVQNLGSIEPGSVQIDGSVFGVLDQQPAPLHLLLPVSWILTRDTVMPGAAKENLRQVIGYEMDRLTPFSADQVYFDFRIKEDVSGMDTLPVELAVVQKSLLTPFLEKLGGSGVSPHIVSSEGLWKGVNFLPPELRPRTDVKRVVLKALPLLVVITLLGVALALPLWQKRKIAMDLQFQESELSARAEEVMVIREKLDKEKKRLEGIRSAWQQFPPTADVVKALTDLLPDDTSLQQLELKGEEVVLRGISRQASSLLKLVEESPGFSDAAFKSSVVQQRGQERFHLSANIVMPFDGVDYTIQPPEENGEPKADLTDKEELQKGISSEALETASAAAEETKNKPTELLHITGSKNSAPDTPVPSRSSGTTNKSNDQPVRIPSRPVRPSTRPNGQSGSQRMTSGAG